MISDEISQSGLDINNQAASRGAGILDNSYEKKYVRNSRLIDRRDSEANKTEVDCFPRERIIVDEDFLDDF